MHAHMLMVEDVDRMSDSVGMFRDSFVCVATGDVHHLSFTMCRLLRIDPYRVIRCGGIFVQCLDYGYRSCKNCFS